MYSKFKLIKEPQSGAKVPGNRQNSAKVFATNINMRLPVIDVNFGSEKCYGALVDSGCTTSLITKELFQQLKKARLIKSCEKVNVTLERASLKALSSRNSVNLGLKFGKLSWKFDFLVVSQLPYPVILGADFIKHSKMILDLSRGEITFEYARLEQVNVITEKTDKADVDIPQESVELTDEQDKKLKGLLHNFRDVISPVIGRAKVKDYVIRMKETCKPVRCKPFQLDPEKNKAMRKIIDKLLENKVISPSTSDWASSSFLVKKKEPGKYRLVCSYKEVNELIEFDQFPMPVMDNLFQYLKDGRVFSSMDLIQAFFQIPLHPSSRKFTAFNTPFGLFEFNSVPQGIKIGCQALGRIVDEVLADLKFHSVLAFADDLVIFSPDPDTHLKDLKEVLLRLRHAGLTVNPDKISLMKPAVHFLGHIVKDGKLFIDPERTEAVRKFPRPKKLKEVQRFLGMCSFYAKFIPNFSKVCSSLNSLKRKGARFQWAEEQQNSFEILKKALTSPPVLHLPCYNKIFYITCDASEQSIAAILQQKVDDKLVPISYASRSLAPNEKGYNMCRKEFLACLFGCEKFKPIVADHHFVLQTDCQAVEYVMKSKKDVGQFARWRLRLSEFNYRIEHIRGKLNVVADALSRMFEDTDLTDEVDKSSSKKEKVLFLQHFPEVFETIGQRQKDDRRLGEIIRQLDNGENVPHYRLVRGILRYQRNARCPSKIVVPEGMYSMIAEYYHSPSYHGHLGIKKTIARIAKTFTWTGIFLYVKQFVRSCHLCQLSKPAQNLNIGLMASQPPKTVFERLHIDLFGPLTRSRRGNVYALIAVDTFSKFVMLTPLRTATSDTVIAALTEKIFSHHGLPKTIISDHGSQFSSHKFHAFVFSLGITHVMTSVARPQGNMSERVNLNLKFALKIYHSMTQNKWDENLAYLQMAFNSAIHDSIERSPSSVFLGRELNHPLQIKWDLLAEESDPGEDTEQRLRQVVECLKKAHAKSKQRYDRNRVPSNFNIGDKVLYKKFVQSDKAKGISNKLTHGWVGPFSVVDIIGPVNVRIQEINNQNHIRVVHVAQLKKYYSRD